MSETKKYTKKDLMDLIIGKLRRNFGRDVEDATSQQMFQACAMVIRDIISARQLESSSKIQEKHSRQVHYLSMEFLMGRSLRKNAYNLGLEKPLTDRPKPELKLTLRPLKRAADDKLYLELVIGAVHLLVVINFKRIQELEVHSEAPLHPDAVVAA